MIPSLTKNILKIFFVLLLFATLSPFVYAEPGTYVPLTPSKEFATGPCNPSKPASESNCQINVISYIPKVFTLAIGVAGALAVIMIMIGGIEYITSDTIGGKSDGKQRITNAVIGLLLAIGAYIILFTINKNALEFDLNKINIAPPVITTPSTAPTVPTTSNAPWPSDATERARLAGMGISINKANCAKIGDSDCTSVTGLSESVFSGLQQLKNRCGISQCVITVTGGTEWWLHGDGIDINKTLHRPGGNVVDLSKTNPVLNGIITSHPKISSPNGCASGQAYNVNGKIYVDESKSTSFTSPHWHVCY
jgi:hypothetical protein